MSILNRSNAKGSEFRFGFMDLRKNLIPSPSSGPNPKGGVRVVHILWYANLFVLLNFYGRVSPNSIDNFLNFSFFHIHTPVRVPLTIISAPMYDVPRGGGYLCRTQLGTLKNSIMS